MGDKTRDFRLGSGNGRPKGRAFGAIAGGNIGGVPLSRIPIVGQSRGPAPDRLASVRYIQTLVVGECGRAGCKGDVIIENFTRPGTCSECGDRWWLAAAQYDRDVDATMFQMAFVREDREDKPGPQAQGDGDRGGGNDDHGNNGR